MSINYKEARPEDFVDGFYRGGEMALARLDELRAISKEERKLKIANLILEIQTSRQHQDPWMGTGTEPIGQIAFGVGAQAGLKGMIGVMIENGLLTSAAFE